VRDDDHRFVPGAGDDDFLAVVPWLTPDAGNSGRV